MTSQKNEKWEGTVLYTRLQSSRSEAGCYEMPGADGDMHTYMYGMPAPYDLEDGAVLRVIVEVVKPGRFKLNPWRVTGDCEKSVEFFHRTIKGGTRTEGFERHGIVDGRCSYCGMSKRLVRIREAHMRLTGEAPEFVEYDPYLETGVL